jgi:hypothetical protein
MYDDDINTDRDAFCLRLIDPTVPTPGQTTIRKKTSMAKFKRVTVGSICKAKEANRPDYLKVRGDTVEQFAKALLAADRTKGMSLKLESKSFQLQNLADAVSQNKLSADMATKVEERINKIPNYVRFEVILLEENTQA